MSDDFTVMNIAITVMVIFALITLNLIMRKGLLLIIQKMQMNKLEIKALLSKRKPKR